MSSGNHSGCSSFFGVLDLVEAMEEIKRHRLRREQPEISEQELEKKIQNWLLNRPQAPDGDASGSTFRKRELIS